MNKTLVTVRRGENEIILCYNPVRFGKRDYFIKWRNINKTTDMSVIEVRTKSGRRPAWKTVMKQFNETVDAIQHVKFS
jgi:hypothetical protein